MSTSPIRRHVVLAALLAAPAAWAQSPPADLTDLVGARGSSGETQMEARGYKLVRSTLVRDQSWTFWWSDVQRQCAAVSTVDGRYAAINLIPEQNCRPGASGDAKPAPPQVQVLTLVCFGQGQHSTYSAHTGYEWNNTNKRYEPTRRMESGVENFSSNVQIDIRDGQGRIHLAGKMIPLLNSGGSDGWWPLRDLQITPDRITASYRLNGLNSPKVQIDRRSGALSIDDGNDFNGKCDVGDWGAGRRF
jgi:hypothetical protein